ncbi:MAG TPA: alanine racemase [Polyangiaceae bacterium]
MSSTPVVSLNPTSLPRVFRPARALPNDALRPTRAEVNLGHLRHNFNVVRRAVGSVPVWAVLKADGYGHGAKAIARTLERAGAAGVCVALIEEGIELRQAGITAPILVIGAHNSRAFSEIIDQNLTAVLHDPGQVEALAEEIRYRETGPVTVHVKLDTGMGRLGLMPRDLPALLRAFERYPEVHLGGLMTHFACADTGDQQSMLDQRVLFDEATAQLTRAGFAPTHRHAANSAAIFSGPQHHLDMVRPGISLFGVSPIRGDDLDLRPVMRVRTEVVATRQCDAGQSVGYGATWTARRPTRIATIPMGYADGLSRGLSNRGHVLIQGQRAPIVGTISMDMTTVDVTDIANVEPGEECVVLGTQKGPRGNATITATEVADHIGTIPWEVLTSISRRVPRFYREP